MVNLWICTASYTHISRKEDTIPLLEVSKQAHNGADSFVATLFIVGFQNLPHSWCLLLLEVLYDVLTPVVYGSWQLLLDWNSGQFTEMREQALQGEEKGPVILNF